MEVTETKSERVNFWMRGLIMLILVILFGIGQWLLNLVALAQFLWLAFANHPNEVLVGFGRTLANWLAEVARFQSCDTDERPFPWARPPAIANCHHWQCALY